MIMEIRQRFITVLDYAETNLVFIGLLGLASFPLYFFIWNYWFPQPYENIWLRLFCSFLHTPWLFYNKFFYKYKSFFSVYFLMSIFICVPVFFSFMLLKNEFSVIWAMSFMAALSLLIIVVYDWLLVTAMVVLGFALAYIMVLTSSGSISFAHFQPEYISIYLFVLITCTLASHRHKLDRQLKIKLKQSLAGSIAHEMRNPLAQIHGSLQLIQMQSPDLNKNQYIGDAYKVIQNGLQVIDLTMDAIAEKPIDTANFKLLSALDLARESVADFAYREAEHANRVSVTGGDFKFMGDPVMVKYVLYNLITNALYYVKVLPDAEIIISVMPDTNGVNQIEVRDTGPGIAPDAIPKLFDSFYTSDKQGGTGLGLFYCKRTMTALGGDIRCESELGKYTAFTLSFPMVSTDQIAADTVSNIEKVSKMDKPPTVTDPVSLAGKTLLIAEDDRISRMIVKSILDRQGVICLEAENGQEALNLLAEYHCDLILTDMQMPIMNGLKLIKTIRQRETRTSNTPMPIIALTSQEGDILNTAIKLGINDYLIKPVSVEGLVPKLQQLLAT